MADIFLDMEYSAEVVNKVQFFVAEKMIALLHDWTTTLLLLYRE